MKNRRSKWLSRAFWITVVWMILAVLGFIVQIISSNSLNPIDVPLSTLITMAGSITLVWMGGDKGEKIVEGMQKPKLVEITKKLTEEAKKIVKDEEEKSKEDVEE